jgi:hypothetical protein
MLLKEGMIELQPKYFHNQSGHSLAVDKKRGIKIWPVRIRTKLPYIITENKKILSILL